jgi:hypothetical protein
MAGRTLAAARAAVTAKAATPMRTGWCSFIGPGLLFI